MRSLCLVHNKRRCYREYFVFTTLYIIYRRKNIIFLCDISTHVISVPALPYGHLSRMEI